MPTTRNRRILRTLAPAAALIVLALVAAGCSHQSTQSGLPLTPPRPAAMTTVPPGATAPAAAPHPHNFVQRHPNAVGVGVGLATHHALKVAAKNAKLHGKQLNWAERHPTLSAIGAGVATSKVIKSTTH